MLNCIILHLILLKIIYKAQKYFAMRQHFYFTLFGLLSLLTSNLHLNQLTHFIRHEFPRLIKIILSYHNLLIILYWVIILPTLLVFFEYISIKYNVKKIIKRKFYHFIAIFIYIPGIKFMDSEVLLFISFCILYIFLLLELIRNNTYLVKSSHLVNQINNFLLDNIDERDNKNLILTHTFLLFGCFSSLFLLNINVYKAENKNDLLKYIGLVSLGIGDSMASIIGSTYGKMKIFPPTKRSLEGFIAGFLSTCLSLCLLNGYLLNFKQILAVGLIFLYEGYTLEIDNLVLPLFSYKIFEVLS
jgi:dolichol kinase